MGRGSLKIMRWSYGFTYSNGFGEKFEGSMGLSSGVILLICRLKE